MTAIEAASVRVSTLADGTLRLVVDIEPRHANAAFALFGAPGVAMALAALKPAAPDKPEKRERMGPLCEWAVYRCGEPEFQRWVAPSVPPSSDAARKAILAVCGVTSRKELDTDKYAATRFKVLILEPYAAWLKAQGTA